MHPANQRPRKPYKLSQGVHKQTGYPRVQWENTLDKRRGYRALKKGGVNDEVEKAETHRDRGEHKVKEQSGI